MSRPEVFEVGDYPAAYILSFEATTEEGERVADKIGRIIRAFNNELLHQPHTPDWLHTYVANKDLGVDIVMVDKMLSNNDRFDADVEDALRRTKGVVVSKLWQAHSQTVAAMTTDKEVVSHFTRYLERATTVSDEALVKLAPALESAIDAVRATLVDDEGNPLPILPKYAFSTEQRALPEKVRQRLGNESGSQDIHAYMFSMDFFEKITQTITHERWKAASAIFSDVLAEHAPRVAIKGGNISDDPIDYGFIPFSPSDVINNLNERLHPNNIKYSVEEQGATVRSEIAGAFAAYTFSIMESRHYALFKERLYQYAEEGDFSDMQGGLEGVLAYSLSDMHALEGRQAKPTRKPK
jgi:hypothetical protein